MASIRISELRPAGSELFQDSESFLNELSENREIDQVLGGRFGGGFNVTGASISNNVNSNNNNVGNTNANTIGNVGNSFGNFNKRRKRW